MRKTIALVGACLVLAFSINTVSAQERCGTMQLLEELMKEDPALKARYEQNIREAEKRQVAKKGMTPLEVYRTNAIQTIPVVFHIVLPNPFLVTDADIRKQIDRLNLDFSGLNPDSTNATDFYTIRGHSQIRFCLAKRDPSGNATNGIERRVSSTRFIRSSSDPIKSFATGGLNAWDTDSYLNIWVGIPTTSSLLGYATFPGMGTLSRQGVVLNEYVTGSNQCYVGGTYDLGRTAVHEVGHYLGLNHIWGDDNGACSGNDFTQLAGCTTLPEGLLFGDTPNQAKETYGCLPGMKTDSCSSVAPGFNYQNYMDYSDDACLTMFTVQQAARMEWVIDNCRRGLLSSLGCVPPLSTPNLDAAISNVVTPGGSEIVGCGTIYYPVPICPQVITPKIKIQNNGLTTLTSIKVGLQVNSNTPVVDTFNTMIENGFSTIVTLSPISLTTGNDSLRFFILEPNGQADQVSSNDQLTMNVIIEDSISIPYTEGFEGTIFPPKYWSIFNPNNDDFTWIKSTNPGNGTTGAVFINNIENIFRGRIDDIRLGGFHVPVSSSVKISFDLAHKASTSSVFVDTLSVLISNDCFATVTQVYKKGGLDLATAGQSSESYTNPILSDWRKVNIYLNNSQTSGGPLYITFRNINGWGNNIFIDNVTVNLVSPGPTISADSATTFCQGGSVTLRSSAASGNQWYKNSVAISGATGATYIANVSGSYTATVTVDSIESSPSNTIDVTVNANGTCPCLQTWNSPITVTPPYSGIGGSFSSQKLLVVNGYPAMVVRAGPQNHLVFFRATDSAGTSWAPPVPIDTSGKVVGNISFQVVNGNPAASYDVSGTDGNDLKYVRANDANGTTWSSPVPIDVTGNVGFYSSLQVVNGNPAIAYCDATNADLKYVRANNPNGTDWGPRLVLDNSIFAQFTSLQVVSGKPAIAYNGSTFGSSKLKYVRAIDNNGANWTAPVTADNSNAIVGQYCSLQVINGNPAISYHDAHLSKNLKYVRATDTSGAFWATPLTIDTTGDVGFYTSLQIVNNNPAISYYDQTNSRLKYIRANDSIGTIWGSPVSVDSPISSFTPTSLQIVKGVPTIAYQDNTKLKYVQASNIPGSNWGTPVSFNNTGVVGEFSSLKVINGVPSISYYTILFNGGLLYVPAGDSAGATWQTPVVADGYNGKGRYNALLEVNGNPAVAYYDEPLSSGTPKILFRRASNAQGTAWATPFVIDNDIASSSANIPTRISMQIVNGNPAVIYYDNTVSPGLKYRRATDPNGETWAAPATIKDNLATNISLQVVNGFPAVIYWDGAGLKYRRATDANGATWSAPVTIDIYNPGANGFIANYSLEIVNGFPAVSYTNGLNLKFARAGDNNGTIWGAPTIPDPTVAVKYHASMKVVNGNPAISYYDETNYDLKYIRANDSSGTVWANPVTLDCNGDVGSYNSMEIVNGGPAISYFDFSNKLLKFISARANANSSINTAIGIITTCGGSEFSINYSSANTSFNSGNVFTVQLSNAAGSFSSPVTIGTLNSTSTSGTINVTIPSNTPQGNNYLIRVISSNPAITGNPTSPLTINSIPTTPTITAGGLTTFCQGGNVTLTSSAVSGNQWYKAGVPISGATGKTYTATEAGLYTVVASGNGCSSLPSAGSLVIVNPKPEATITPTGAVAICSGKSVILNANLVAGYTYQWKKAGGNIAGATSSSYTATTTGVYTVVVTNASGCSTTSGETNVTTGTAPVVTVAPPGPLTFCAGKNVLLKATAGAGYTYQWKKASVNINDATLSSYTPTATGAYSVVLTNAGGCSATSTIVNVTVNNVPLATVAAGGATTFCEGKTVQLKAVTGAGYTYQWKRGAADIAGATSSNYNAATTGIYTVIVTNAAGCSATSVGLNVVVKPKPLSTIQVVGSTTFCSGKNVLLKANTGTNYTYQWIRGATPIPGAVQSNFAATEPGQYTVIVTNASGCSVTSAAIPVSVNPLPVAKITPVVSLIFCAGQSVLLRANTGTNYTYQWRKAGINITGATQVNYTATASGVYSVVVTNAAGCPVTSVPVTVTVNNAPLATVAAAGDTVFCAGKNVLLRAIFSSGYTYQWRKNGINIPQEDTSIYTATATGNYSVVVTNAAGCSTTSRLISVAVTPAPLATVDVAGDTTFCAGKSVLLRAISGTGYTYQWKKNGINIPAQTQSNYTATTTGIYTVVVTNVAGCSSTSRAINVTVNPAPLATITPPGPLTFPQGGSVTLNASAATGNTYQWKKDGFNIVGATATSYTATSSGNYTVVITNSSSCQATSQPVLVSVTSERLITKGEAVIRLYPNPLYRSEYLNIEWQLTNADKGIQVNISDITGRQIDSRFLKSYDKKIRIKGASGVYIVEVRWGKNERKIFRIVKIE